MKSLSRSTALKIAAALFALMGAVSILNTLPLIARGAAGVAQSTDSPPYFILMIGLLTGVIAIVGAYGAWNRQRWGIVLTILVNLLNGLTALPGILFAPQPGLRVISIITVGVAILVIVFCLWRERRTAAV